MMKNINITIKNFITSELSGWKTWEAIWLLACCMVICGLSVWWGDSFTGIVAATTGVAYTVLSGKGKRSAYFFGVINALLYAWISYGARFYGEVMLNAGYFFPMQFYGFYVWSKNMNQETGEVNKRAMTSRQRIKMTLAIIAATVVYGVFLKSLGGRLPFTDALSTVISVVAMVVGVQMYMEQWILWTVVNVVTIVMWGIAFANGSDSLSTLLMWVVYLLNGFIMYFKWRGEAMNETRSTEFKMSENKTGIQ